MYRSSIWLLRIKLFGRPTESERPVRPEPVPDKHAEEKLPPPTATSPPMSPGTTASPWDTEDETRSVEKLKTKDKLLI